MATFLLEVDAGQVGTALEALARAGVPVRELGDPPPRRSPARESGHLDLFGGTAQTAAPAGTWSRMLPGGIAGELVQSGGQTTAGDTIWLSRGPGKSVAWSVTRRDLAVRLERGPCPEDFLGELGAEGLARVLRAAADATEER